MGKYYNEAAIPDSLRRNYDVYDRIQELGIDLGSFEDNVTSLKGAGIAGVVFHSTGIVYLSGAGGGERQMNDDPERVKHGQQAASDIADSMLARLHWALTCGGEGGDLNDVLYTVKALGMVVSTDVEFNSGPAVVNGFSFRWQSVYGGGMGDFASDGEDSGGYAGVHARSAIGGFHRPFLPGAGNYRGNSGSAGQGHHRQSRLGFPTSPVDVGQGQQRPFCITPYTRQRPGDGAALPGETNGPRIQARVWRRTRACLR